MTELDIHGPYYSKQYRLNEGYTIEEGYAEAIAMYPDAEYIDEYWVVEIEPTVTWTQSGLRRI